MNSKQSLQIQKAKIDRTKENYKEVHNRSWSSVVELADKKL